jgi:hypothetical protein
VTHGRGSGRARQARGALRRLTGISVPVGGIQWEYREADADVAARIVSFLEDRRVLYVPSEAELPKHAISSVLEIRRFLTHELGAVADRPDIADTIRALRAAARKFLDTIGPYVEQHPSGNVRDWHGTPEWTLNQALGELRGIYGVHIALLVERYGLAIEPDLATILPIDQDDADDWFYGRFSPG